MRRMLAAGLCAAVLAGAGAAAAPDTAATAWWAHVRFLADDSMEGRNTGSPAHLRAAEYVAAQFEKAGLEPAGVNGYIQPVTFKTRRIVEAQSSLALVRNGRVEPIALGEDANLNVRIDPAPSTDAPLVFVGYGLRVPEASFRRPRRPRSRGQGRRLSRRRPLVHSRRASRALPVGRRTLGRAEAGRRHRHDQPREPEEPWTCHGRAPRSRDCSRRWPWPMPRSTRPPGSGCR